MLEVEVHDASGVDIFDTECDLSEEMASFRFWKAVYALLFEVVEDITSFH